MDKKSLEKKDISALRFFKSQKEWFRCSDYDVVQIGDEHYLVPAENAAVSYYRPFDDSITLLNDFITIADSMKSIREANQRIPEILNAIPNMMRSLDFFKQHENLIEQMEKIEIENVPWAFAKKLLLNEAATALEGTSRNTESKEFQKQVPLIGSVATYMFAEMIKLERSDADRLRSFAKNYGLLGLMFKYWIDEGKDDSGFEWMLTTGVPEPGMNGKIPLQEFTARFFPLGNTRYRSNDREQFALNYCEPISWVISEFQDLTIQRVKGSSQKSTVRKLRSLPIEISAIQNKKNQIQLEWDYRSLIEAISILQVGNLITGTVRTCISCQCTFIADNPNKLHCSRSCAMRSYVQKSRKKDKKAKSAKTKKQ